MFFFVVLCPLFGSISTISRFGERFRDVQYSLVSFLFAVLLTAPSHTQKWGHVPLCLMELEPLNGTNKRCISSHF